MTPVPETAAAIARGTPAPPHVLGAHSERGPRHAEANNGYPQRQSLRRGLPVDRSTCGTALEAAGVAPPTG